MYTKQIQSVVGSLRGQIPDAAVSAFEGLLGNCVQQLEHRAPITVAIDGNLFNGSFIPKNCDGGAPAAIKAANRSGSFSGSACKTDCVTNGLAFRGVGPSHFDSARIETLYVNDLLDECGDEIVSDVDATDGFFARRFIITNENPGGTDKTFAFAKEVVWNGTEYVTLADVFVVADFTDTGEFYRRWRNGFYGWCVLKKDRETITVSSVEYDLREVLWCETRARYIEYLLTSPMSAGSANGTVLRYWGAPDCVSPGSSVSISDRLGHIANAQAGYRGIAIYDETERKYVTLSEDSDGAIIPEEAALFILRITDGIRLANCIYDGERVSLEDTSGLCDDDFALLESVWITAPNYTLDIYEGSYHWGVLVDPAYDVDGDIRPLYAIKAKPTDFKCLFVAAGTAMDGDCLFAASLIAIDLSAMYDEETDTTSACRITSDVLASVKVYLPNRGECETFREDTYLWGWRIAYASADVYVSDYDLHDQCNAINAVGTSTGSFECDDAVVISSITKFPGTGFHDLEDEDPPIVTSLENQFGLAGTDTSNTWSLPDNEPIDADILAQVSHSCIRPMKYLGGGGPCKFQAQWANVSVPITGDPIGNVISLAVLCDCPCDNEQCGCPDTGGDAPVGTITYTNKQVFGTLPETRQYILNFTFNGPLNRWEADFSCDAVENVLLYEVFYQVDGGEPELGWAQIGCNWNRDDVIQVYDDSGTPIPGAVVVSFTDFVDSEFTILPELSMTCRRYYRCVWTCESLVELGDGSFRFAGGAYLVGLAPPGYDRNGISAGQPVTDAESSGTLLRTTCRSVEFDLAGRFDWGIISTPDFLTFTLCGFRTDRTLPARDDPGAGSLLITW